MLQCKWIFAAALLTVLLVDDAQAIVCSDLTDPKVRTFANLTKFQGNSIPFDPMNSESAGNYVKIDQVKSNLEKNDFISFNSDYIVRIYLNDKGIKTIESQTFNQLQCLRYLNLDGNQLKLLPGNVFDQMKMTVYLNLSSNYLSNLPDELFGSMYELKDLDLSHNKIKSLRQHLFDNQTNLQHLNVSHNLLNFLHFEDWKNMKALTLLDISFNFLHSIEFPTTFVFANLKTLFLNDNQLKDISAFSMRNKMPHLALVKLDNNPFACDDLAYILRALDESRVIYEGTNTTANNLVGIDCSDFTDSLPSRIRTKLLNVSRNDHIWQQIYDLKNDVAEIKNLLIWFVCLLFAAIILKYSIKPCKILIAKFPRGRYNQPEFAELTPLS